MRTAFLVYINSIWIILHEVFKHWKGIFHRTNSYFILKHFLLHFKSIYLYSQFSILCLYFDKILIEIGNLAHFQTSPSEWRAPCIFLTLTGKKLKLSAVCWLGFTALLIIDWSLSPSSLYHNISNTLTDFSIVPLFTKYTWRISMPLDKLDNHNIIKDIAFPRINYPHLWKFILVSFSVNVLNGTIHFLFQTTNIVLS